MTTVKRISAFFIAALLVSVLGCAETPKHQSTGAYMDDSWITTKVKAEILKEPGVKVTQVNVETYKGVVQLSGFVDSTESMNKATAIARSVKGVVSVKNDMRLR